MKSKYIKFYELVKDDLTDTFNKTKLICWEFKWTDTKYLHNAIKSTIDNMSSKIEIIKCIYIKLH